jgi:hypothetical protein
MNSEKAIIRTCDICGKINAISVDVQDIEKQMFDLRLIDHTVELIPKEDAMILWQSAGRCDHKTLIQELRKEIELLRKISYEN